MRIYFDTLGCFKNQEDSERAAGLLEEAGHSITDEAGLADVLIVNTCGFIEDAKRESLARILELAEEKDNRKLIVTGCLTQRYSDELFEEIPEADALLGVNDYARLPNIIDELFAGGRLLCAGGEEGVLTGKRHLFEPGATAYLKIAEGCDNRCSYCAIPAIRGGYRSVPEELLVDEAVRLAEGGASELVLIAQDVSAYGIDLYGEYTLPRLLRRLCLIGGVEWIRLMYCYEERITDELIDVISSEPKVCKYIDIPLQHASDDVLRRMGRRSSRAHIGATLAKLRSRVPQIAVRTTFMTGFPGETEDDFAELMDFASRQRFDRLGVFAFSPEDGTRAADMADQIPMDIAEERRDMLMRQQMDISLEKNRALVGQTLRVLVTGAESEVTEFAEAGTDDVFGNRTTGVFVYTGRTEYDAPEIDEEVIFSSDTPLEIGTFTSIRINDAMDYDLVGRRI